MALKQETKQNFDFVLRNLLAGGKFNFFFLLLFDLLNMT